MQMHFAFSDNVTLLFDFWTVQTVTGLLLSCLIVLLLSVLYELSKVWKSNLLKQVLLTLPLTPDSLTPSLISDTEANVSANSEPLLTPDPLYPGDGYETLRSQPARLSSSHCRWWLLHSFLAFLHTAQVVLGYMLMLLVMSYNTAVFLAVLLGSGVGYYLAFPLLARYYKPHRL
ncbi:protein SLC31A2 [Hyperolius riggenbachi]|uniref:protein SLC31A2 n=1 Tax=Hyperolius riggenbachi TaxID=752182 RepID=UPI0035A30FDB